MLRPAPRGSAERDPGFDLEPSPRARRKRADRANRAAGDEERPLPGRLDGGGDQAELESAQPVQPPQALDDVLERLDPVAKPGRLLVALALGEVRESCAEPRKRPAL